MRLLSDSKETFQPIRKIGTPNRPRILFLFIFLPSILFTIKEFLTMTFDFCNLVSFQSILIPIVVMLSPIHSNSGFDKLIPF